MRPIPRVLERVRRAVSLDCFLVRDFLAAVAVLLTSPSGDPSKVCLSSSSSCMPLSQLTLPKSNGHPCSLKPSSIARRRYLPSAGSG